MFWMFFGYVLEEPFHLKLRGHFGYQPKNQSNLISKWEDGFLCLFFLIFFSSFHAEWTFAFPTIQPSFATGKLGVGKTGKPPNQNSVHSDVSHKTNGPSKTSMSRGSSTPPCVFCDAQSRGLRMNHMTPSPRSEATLLLTCQWSSNVIQRPLVRSDARRVFVGSDICKGGKVKG